MVEPKRTPWWRRLLVAGWVMFAVSFFLPVLDGLPGWEAAAVSLAHAENPIQFVSALSNILIAMTFFKLNGVRPPPGRWLTRLIAGAAVVNLYWFVMPFFDEGWSWEAFTTWSIGYWTWIVSFMCIATALLVRDREAA